MNASRVAAWLLGLAVGSGALLAAPAEETRPSIWVNPADRPAILAKIAQEPWAQARFEALRERADAARRQQSADRDGYLRGLPWQPDTPAGEHPALVSGNRNPAADDDGDHGPAVARLQRYLLAAVDCAVLYYLSGDESYAAAAADVLHAMVAGLLQVEPSDDPVNGGWIYQNDHLYEARAIGAQLPLVYDLVAPYLRAGGTVWDLASRRPVAFDSAQAQQVFRTYARLALEHGIIDSNWPVLEQASLLHNVFALDDPDERARLLHLALEVDLPHQDSLRKMLAECAHAGGLWPESLQYSAGVLNRLIYSLALLQRRGVALPGDADFGLMATALLRLEGLKFPNGDHVRFGDGPRRFGVAATSLELAYAATRAQPPPAADAAALGAELQRRLAAGDYDRRASEGHRVGADTYLDPLAVLWFAPQVEEAAATAPVWPTTDALPFAGLVLQRNLAPDGDPRHGLMAAVSGGHYVHAHASGMALELYGAGEVLGASAGKGRYTTEEHENYRRLFAANNTVIVNGASRSEGGWVNLGINQVELVASEPAVGAPPVSANHSFTRTRFRDDRGADAEADQERVVGIVRTGPQTGFYVDVFRSQSARSDPWHDYVYHNIGDSGELWTGAERLPTAPQPDRFPPVPGAQWRRNRSFLWPGWHVFNDVRVSAPTTAAVTVRFDAAALGTDGGGMRAHFPSGPIPREFALAAAPATMGAPAPYDRKTTPTVIVRQRGQAWAEPFAVVFEPVVAGRSVVESVDRLEGAGDWVGLQVVTRDHGIRAIHDIVIMTKDDATWMDPTGRVTLQGSYAVVTRGEDGELHAVYLGAGHRLEVDDWAIVSVAGELFSAAWSEGASGVKRTASGGPWWQRKSGIR